MRLPWGRAKTNLRDEYNQVFERGDLTAARHILERILERDPDTAWAWFDLGLIAKWRRDWVASAAANERALQISADSGDPAAWNLGIAATALGDWDTARRAWRIFGIDLLAGAGPIEADFGVVPVRLNPELRHPDEPPRPGAGDPPSTEVVWCQRVCPARAVIQNVPLPESQHRWGDVVLHDGEPVGERELEPGDVRSVFNEIERLEPSTTPTLSVEVACPSPDDSAALQRALAEAGLVAEDWTSSTQLLCRECSEGRPRSSHDHPEPDWSEQRLFGLAGDLDAASRVLRGWAGGGGDRTWADLVIVC